MATETKKRNGYDIVYPVFGVLCNAYVVAESMRAVGKLRHKFVIRAPSIEPHDDMKEGEKQRWYRTYRAQVNCVEWFSLTSPVFIGGALVGKEAFGSYGKYVPGVLGAISVLNAYYRYRYLLAYQEEADSRNTWFQKNSNDIATCVMDSFRCMHSFDL
eukprot:771853_1